MTTATLRRTHPPIGLAVAAGTVLWIVAWFLALPASEWASYGALGLERGSQAGDSIAFFLYDVPKVLLLLTGIVTLVSFLRSFVSPERVRKTLAGRGVLPGTMAAAGFGIITPFCSCSAVPLFIGFVEVGVPLGVTFAFLVASPMVNEVAIVLLWGLFGPGIAIAYMAAGLTVASSPASSSVGCTSSAMSRTTSGRSMRRATIAEVQPTLEERIRDAWRSTQDIVRRVLPYVIAGIGIGALIHGFVPTDLVVSVGGRENPLAVPALVILGIPLYSNAAGTIPIIEALLAKGLPVGSALAFMMAITALSIPEMVILRKVMKPRLIAVFVSIVGAGILLVGYGCNLFLS